MKPRSRAKHKGRKDGGNFSAIPHAVQDCANWKQCSGTGIKLLCDLTRQFNGKNNGDLCASLSVLKRRGWKSPDTLARALGELRHFGLVTQTRQGGLNMPSLYALTWRPIDDCGGKLDTAPTRQAPGDWKQDRPPFQRHRKKKTPVRNP